MKGVIFVLAFFCLASVALAASGIQTPEIIKNIAIFGPDAQPDGFVWFNSTTVFFAATSSHGRELWVWTQGQGSSLFLDIAPGRASGLGYPSYITGVNLDTVGLNAQKFFVFPAWTESTGWELWSSNGTVAGTKLLKDIYPGNRSSNPMELVTTDNVVVFTAEDPVNGIEVWATNGLVATLSADIYNTELSTQAPTSSQPSGYVVVESSNGIFGGVYFTAFTAAAGWELYYARSNFGTGPVLMDINEGAGSSYPYNLTPINGKLYFTAFSPASGWEAYVAAGSTFTLIDVWAGPGSSYPASFVRTPVPTSTSDSTVFFSAYTPTWGRELWRSDGTAGNTKLHWDIFKGPGNSDPVSLVSVPAHQLIYFAAVDDKGRYVLYYVNGRTTAPFHNGTLEISSAVTGSITGGDVELQGSIVITNARGNGSEWYFSAKTSDSGREVFSIRQPSNVTSSIPNIQIVSYLGQFGGINSGEKDAIGNREPMLFNPVALTSQSFAFAAYSDDGGMAYILKASNDTNPPEATYLGAMDISGRDGSSYPTYFSVGVNTNPSRPGVREDRTFSAVGYYGDELYYSSGKLAKPKIKFANRTGIFTFTEPTRLLNAVNGGFQGSEPSATVLFPGEMYTLYFYSAFSYELGNELCFTNTDTLDFPETDCLDIIPGPTGSYPTNIHYYPRNNMVLWNGYNEFVGNEIFFINGDFDIDDPEWKHWDLVPGNGSSQPNNFYNYDSVVVFVASTPAWGDELWRTDGTFAGTTLVMDINPGPQGSSVDNFYQIQTLGQGPILFFTAYHPTSGYELWAYDNVAPKLAADVFIGVGDSLPGSFAQFNNYLYFAATHATAGRELFVTSTTTLTARYALVFDLETGPADSNPEYVTAFRNSLYFSATHRTNGTELYWTRGAIGKAPFSLDINNGAVSSDPEELTVIADKLYFTAHHNSIGRELWSTYPDAPASASPRGLKRLELVYNGNKGRVSGNATVTDGSSHPTDLFAIRQGLGIFSAYDAFSGREVYANQRP